MSFSRIVVCAIGSWHAIVRQVEKTEAYNSVTSSRLGRPLSGNLTSAPYLVSILIHAQNNRLSRSVYSWSFWRVLESEIYYLRILREVQIGID